MILWPIEEEEVNCKANKLVSLHAFGLFVETLKREGELCQSGMTRFRFSIAFFVQPKNRNPQLELHSRVRDMVREKQT